MKEYGDDMLTEKFLKATPILETIEAHQHEAYFVGGCVRDLLLDRPVKDIDIATSATPDVIQTIFPTVIPVGIEHGTVIVRHDHESYEVTTFRTEGDYSDGRHPDHVEFIRNIEEDLQRRDFTMNALAMDKEGNIIDLFGGRKDLERKIIRTVGEGKERFGEDALRIIRALRFSSQLGFRIEESTYEAMIACKSAVLDISIERITKEMEQFFAGDHITIGMKYFLDTKIYEVLPVFKDEPDLIEKLPNKLLPLSEFAEVIALFHYLFPEITISRWVTGWKCSNRTKRLAIELVEALHHFATNGLDEIGIYHIAEEHFASFIRLTQLLFNSKITVGEMKKRKEKLPIQSRNDLAIDGHDLLNLFPERKGGPWVKRLLDQTEEAVILGEVANDYEKIKEWLKWTQHETD